MAGIEVSRDEGRGARTRAGTRPQVALAEVATDVKRGERPNRPIEGDTKRPLKGFSGERRRRRISSMRATATKDRSGGVGVRSPALRGDEAERWREGRRFERGQSGTARSRT